MRGEGSKGEKGVGGTAQAGPATMTGRALKVGKTRVGMKMG